MTNEERKYALKIFKLCVNDGIILKGSPLYIACKTAKEALKEKKKMGHWEWVQYDGNPEIGNFHCSECRYIPASFNMSARKLNYCPKCGAKMQ
jgi:transcription initiation factor IIE alpha subunit